MATEAAIGVAFVTGIFTLVAALGGAVVTAALALLTNFLNQRHQTNESRVADKRRIRDAKRERARRPLRQLLHAAWTMNDVLVDQSMLRGEQTEEERDEELLEKWSNAIAAANEALGDLSMEQDTDELTHEYYELTASFRKYQQQRRRAIDEAAGWPHDLWNEVRDRVSNLQRMIRDAAAALDEPL